MKHKLSSSDSLPVLAFKWFTILVTLVATLVSVRLSFRFNNAGIVYVSKQGSWIGNGTSWELAYLTIQQALDKSLPGDVIIVDDGYYQERLHLRNSGTKDKPITLKAKNPGAVTVGWTQPLLDAISGPWIEDESGILTTETRWPIYRLQLEGADFYRIHYGGPEQMKALVARDGAMNCFCYRDGRLWVWMPDSEQHKLSSVVSHPRVPEPREWGEFRSANLTISADHIHVQGIEFSFGVGSSILVDEANDVFVEDCLFSGATYGVSTLLSTRKPLKIALMHCLYHNFPQYHWRKNWLTWGEVYAGYDSSSLIATNYDFVQVEDCLVVHGGDGIRVSNDGGFSQSRALIQNNLVCFQTDDAFEIEGPSQNVVIRENVVYECHESLGLSPVEKGPVYVSDNLFVHPRDGLNGAQVKLINHVEWPGSQIQNILLDHNLFIGNWLCWHIEASRDVDVTGNVFAVLFQADPPWPEGVTLEDNIFLPRSSEAQRNVENSLEEISRMIAEGAPALEFHKAGYYEIVSGAGPRWLHRKDCESLKEPVADLEAIFDGAGTWQ